MAIKKTVAKKTAKKKTVKPEGTLTYIPNDVYKTKFTIDEQIKFNKLPKGTLFALPKGVNAKDLSPAQRKQMQARRVLDRQRTLARGANIIRRKTLGK
jgi:hypothetical protein